MAKSLDIIVEEIETDLKFILSDLKYNMTHTDSVQYSLALPPNNNKNDIVPKWIDIVPGE